MSIPKAAGIETEYGIIIWGAPTFNPFVASQLLLNAYHDVGGPAISTWGYYGSQTGEVVVVEADEGEWPDEDTGESVIEEISPIAETSPVTSGNGSGTTQSATVSSASTTAETKKNKKKNKKKTAQTQQVVYSLGSLMLANGARYYIDHAHPEYCTPETLSPRGVVAADKAGERIVARCLEAVNSSDVLPEGQQIMIYKNNSDQKGNSYGCHENYLLSMDLFENLLHRRSHMIYRYLLPFQISRVVICGAGKVGSENRTVPVPFQLSQRADFFEMVMGIQTTYRRPLFNTRDESHTDSGTFRRLHVILGDANMSEVSTYLKVGITQLVLHMIEDGFITADLTLSDPLESFRTVSRDLTFQQPLKLESGELMTAVAMQEKYLELAEQYLDATGGTDEQWDVWQQWADVVDALADGDFSYLARRLDWAIKKTVLDRYLQAQGTTWDAVMAWQAVIETIVAAESMGRNTETMAQALVRASKLEWDDYAKQRDVYFGLRRLDLEYHDIRSTGDEVGLFYRLQGRGLVERILTDEEIERSTASPPPDTRAWLRGKTVEKFAPYIVGADWSYIKLRHPDSTANLIYRLEFPNPLVGTEADMSGVWDRLETPDQMFSYFYQGQHG